MRRRLTSALAIVLACTFIGRVAAAEGPTTGDRPDPGTREILALNLYHEAKGEGREGMLAVGWVVLNRLADGAFPRAVADIVTQGCQFGWLCDDRPDEPTDHRAWRRALAIAAELLTADPPPDPTRGAMWFHNAGLADPGWCDRGRMAPSTRIGNHLFYAKADRVPRPKAKPRVPEAVLAGR